MNLEQVARDTRAFFQKLFEPKIRFPDKPNREYWVCKGYEPGSWTEEHIEAAKRAGWTEIVIQQEDEYPWLKGTVHGVDPDIKGGFYIPNW